MASKREKLHYLDIAKGLGIFVVILAHVDTGDNPLCSWIGSFCMPIFFLVSGALLYYLNGWKQETLWQIILKRIKGVLYPYFSFSAFIVLCYTFMRVVFKRGSFSNIIEIIKSTVQLSGYDALWFMPTLFFAEILCLLWLRYSKNQIMDVVGFVLAIGISYGCYCVLHYGIIEEYADGWFAFVKLTRVLMSVVFIYAGYLYFEFKDKLLALNNKVVSAVLIILCIINVFACQYNHFVDYAFVRIISLPLFYAGGIINSITVMYVGEVFKLRSKALEFFGKNSLTMMATHNPIPVLATIDVAYRKYVPTLGRYPDDVIVAIIIIIVEIPIVLFINKFLPFIVRLPKKGK